jgi:hypothetical protein
MAIPVSVADLNAFTNRYIAPKLTDVHYKESPIFAQMVGKNRVSFKGGSSITEPIMYAELNGGFISKGDTVNVSYVPTDAAFSLAMKYLYTNITLYGADDVLNRGREAAFSMVETKMANASMKIAKLVATALYQDGQASAQDVTDSAGLLSTSVSLDGLLAWIDDGNSDGSFATADDLTRSFASIGGLTRADLFASPPTFTGFTSTPASAIGGANAYTNRAFSTFSLNEINAACGHAWFGSQYVDTIVTSLNGYNRFFNAIQPNQRFMDTGGLLGKIGFQTFRFNGAQVVLDKYMPAGLMLGLNSNYLNFYISDSEKFQFGFTGFKEAQNSIDYSGQVLLSANLTVPSPRHHFKLVGSALS